MKSNPFFKKHFVTVLLFFAVSFANGQISKSNFQFSIDSLLPSGSQVQMVKVRAAFAKTLSYAENAMKQEVDVKWFGAKGNGVNDDTNSMRSALEYCINNSKVLLLTEGNYIVSNYLINKTDYSGSENLYIRIVGNVKITAATGATAFALPLIDYGHAITTNISITGDILTVDLNNKFSGFLEAKNYGIVSGVNYQRIEGNATINPSGLNIFNSYAINSGDVTAVGLMILGTFKYVRIENVYVNLVTRFSTSNTDSDCKGIAVSALKGECLINNCKVSNVLANAAYRANADGISVFGLKSNNAIENSFRTGVATITNCILSDNEGRNIKIQTSESTIQNCKFLRQYIVTIDNGHDVDVQFGNGRIIGNTAIYKKNGSTSPLGTYFAAFKFQNVLPNSPMYSLAENNTIYTEALIPYAFFITHGNSLSPDTVSRSVTEIVNNHIINTGNFIGIGALQRGFCEFNADEVSKVVGKAEINLRDNSCFFSSTAGLLSYNNAIYNVKSKLLFRVENNRNTNTSLSPKVFHNYWGSQIDSVDNYKIWGNTGFDEVVRNTWKIDLSKGKILAPTRVSMDLYYHFYMTNKPPTIGVEGNAIITVLGDWPSGNAKVEIYENTGGVTDYLHVSTANGTWKKVALTN